MSTNETTLDEEHLPQPKAKWQFVVDLRHDESCDTINGPLFWDIEIQAAACDKSGMFGQTWTTKQKHLNGMKAADFVRHSMAEFVAFTDKGTSARDGTE